jgi:hypothetical protein
MCLILSTIAVVRFSPEIGNASDFFNKQQQTTVLSNQLERERKRERRGR